MHTVFDTRQKRFDKNITGSYTIVNINEIVKQQ